MTIDSSQISINENLTDSRFLVHIAEFNVYVGKDGVPVHDRQDHTRWLDKRSADGYAALRNGSVIEMVPAPPADKFPTPNYDGHLYIEARKHLQRFFIYKVTPSSRKGKKWDKKPLLPKNFTAADMMYGDEAVQHIITLGPVGYCLGRYFFAGDQEAFYDLDGCYNPATGEWNDIAKETLPRFSGAYMELSISGEGAHVTASYTGELAHGCDNAERNLELYSSSRGMAIGTPLPGTGTPDFDCTAALHELVSKYFPTKSSNEKGIWTEGPEVGWDGPTDDSELLRVFLSNIKQTPTNRQIYEGDQLALAAYKSEPGRKDGLHFDPTAVDLIFAGRLMFSTGNDCERTLRLMQQSPYAALREDKWSQGRVTVLRRETILKAFQENTYRRDYTANNTDWKKAAAAGHPVAPIGTPVKLPKEPPARMGPAAFHGILGDFVRLVEPSTEGDINALVVTFLTAFGCFFGRQAHHYVEDTRHGLNLFSVTVGESSKARKGTITSRVTNLLKLVNRDFIEKRLHSGLSTGEGLIYCIRDPREDSQPKDPGVQDKRLLALESEFASVLDHGKRDGNILSAIMRNAWDGSPLRILAKTNKDSCQQPHISLIGNITVDELQRCLSDKDRSNGFGNRILWVYARRSKILSRPTRVPEKDLQAIADRINAVLFNMPGELKWSDAAVPLWDEEYARLTESGGDGLVDALTARSESQVLRMAMIYAVLDQSSVIELEHLRAALEVWRYCEASARFIFGDASGNRLAEEILVELLARPEGMTQTELNKAFGGHKSTGQLRFALDALLKMGKVQSIEKSSKTKGAQVWAAV